MKIGKIKTLICGLLSSTLLYSCADPACDKFENEIKQKSADNTIDQKEWQALQASVKKNSDKLQDCDYDFFTDSTLREFIKQIHIESNEGKAPKKLSIWVKPPVKIDKVNLYLETSGSMKGYLPIGKNSRFRDNISELISSIENYSEAKSFGIYTLMNKDSIITHSDPRAFRMEMATVPMSTSKSSQLHEIFKSLLQRSTVDDITLFVSDGIISFPPDKIIQNSEINKQEVKQHQIDIKDSFKKFNQKGVGVALYSFKSNFTGAYYTYKNIPQAYIEEERPYYLWVFGNKESLNKFIKFVESENSFKPENKLYLGLMSEFKPDYCLFLDLLKKGKWVKSGNKINNAEITGPTEFCIGMDLSAIPTYALQKEYLKNNLKIEGKGVDVQFKEILNAKDIQRYQDKIKPKELPVALNCTHFVVFSIKSISLDNTTANVSLKEKAEDWYVKQSTMDDQTPILNRNKTFAFQQLVDGIKDAYQTGKEDFFTIQIEINK